MARRARRHRAAQRRTQCAASVVRCTQSSPPHGGCPSKQFSKRLAANELDAKALHSEGELELQTIASSQHSVSAKERQSVQNEDLCKYPDDGTDVVENSVAVGDGFEDTIEVSDEEDEDQLMKAKQAALEKLQCARRRRCLLTSWVNRRVVEICNEDEDEPDSEDERVRSALMDAIGAASANVEAEISTGSLDLMSHAQGMATSTEVSLAPNVRFASSSMTFVMKPAEVESSTASVSTMRNTCWVLDQVTEMSLFDSPSAPLTRWRDKPCEVEEDKQGET